MLLDIKKILKRLKKKVSIVRRIYYTAWVKFKANSVGKNLKVNFKSDVNRKTVLGNNVNFNGLKVGGRGSLEIGDNFHSGPDVLIITDNHNYENATRIPYDEKYISKKVVIEDNVWVGARVIILPGVTISEGAIIQAGAVVVKDVPKCSIVGGNPAKVFKQRNIEHYFKLKNEGKFY